MPVGDPKLHRLMLLFSDALCSMWQCNYNELLHKLSSPCNVTTMYEIAETIQHDFNGIFSEEKILDQNI